ncbi:hypothetical protein TNCV_1056081 [Trichonephila clavipes]|nr:hypothetical protein TNCV_1056081 [Trichonephila clavipes]
MSEDQVNAIKTPAACMKTVSEERVQLCGHNKNISFLNEDGVSRQGKVMRQHPKQKWFPRQSKATRQHPKKGRFSTTELSQASASKARTVS